MKSNLNYVLDWFCTNKLKLNVSKTQFIIFGSRRNVKLAAGKTLSFNVDTISQSSVVNYLGVQLDNILSYDAHVSMLSRKISKQLGALSNIRYLIPLNIRKQLYQALVISHLIYCITIWSATSEVNLKRMEVLYNRICRHMLMIKTDEMRTQMLYTTLDLLNFRQLILYHNSLFSYKIFALGLNLEITLPPRNLDIHSYPTRRNDNLHTPRVISTFGKKAPSYILSHTWNAIPYHLKAIANFPTFKKLIRNYTKNTILP